MRGFAAALDSLVMAFAEKSGLALIETLAVVKSRQIKDGCVYLGIDCMERSTDDMREQDEFEALSLKIPFSQHTV